MLPMRNFHKRIKKPLKIKQEKYLKNFKGQRITFS